MEEIKGHGRLDDVLLRANELGIEYHPVGLKGGVSIDVFNVDLDEQGEPKTFQYATVKNENIVLFENLYDVFDDNKGISLDELPDDAQQEVVDRLFDSLFAENVQMVVVYDKQVVPSYALGALINGDFSGIENPEDEQNIRDFMDKKAGYIYDVEPDSEGFSSYPAFGLPTDCESVFFVKAITPKELLEQQKAGSNKELESAMEVKVDPELREARGYLMDVISHALSQMNGHVEIEHTELPSVPMKGDFWKEEGLNVYMELIKGEHNVQDAMFHDVHAEEYTLDEVINKLDYSETYALTIAVREAQIKDIVSSFEGQEIYFDEPLAVSRDDDDIDKDYVAAVKIDDDGSLNISGHRVDDDGETHAFYHADDLYLNGYDDLLGKLSEMQQQAKIDGDQKSLSAKKPSGEKDTFSVDEILSHDDKFRYMLLSRMQSDVKYFLGNGNRHVPDLWAGDVDKHIDLMFKLWDSFDEKPEWLSREEIATYAEQMRQPGAVEQLYPLKKELKDILKGAGLDYSPLAPTFDITLKSLFNSAEDQHLRYATFNEERIHLYGKYEDALDLRNYEIIDELSPENQLKLVKGLVDYYRNENNNVTLHVDTQQVPSYALSAIINGDFSGIDSEEDAKNIRDFMERKAYEGAVFCPREEHPSFTSSPAFGLATDCVTVDILRTGSIKQFREEQENAALGEAKEHLMSTLASARTDLGDTILIKPTAVKLAGLDSTVNGVFLAPDGNDGGEYRLFGKDAVVLAVEEGGHTEFDVSKILDNTSSVNALTDAVHDAHANALEQKSKQAIHDRITNSWQRTFTPNQVDVLNRYHQIATPDTPASEVFSRLLHEVSQEPDVAHKSEKWIIDAAKELDEVAKGNTREEPQQLKR